MSRIGQSIDAERGLMVAWGSGAGGNAAVSASDHRFFFFCGRVVMKCSKTDYADGGMTLNMLR